MDTGRRYAFWHLCVLSTCDVPYAFYQFLNLKKRNLLKGIDNKAVKTYLEFVYVCSIHSNTGFIREQITLSKLNGTILKFLNFWNFVFFIFVTCFMILSWNKEKLLLRLLSRAFWRTCTTDQSTHKPFSSKTVICSLMNSV